MGYYSHIKGEIQFDPPLNKKDIPGPQELFAFDTDNESVEVEEGTLIRVSASRIVCRHEDDVRAYDVVAELRALTSSVQGRQWTGEFRIEGEENSDIRRVFVTGHADGTTHVVEWRVELLWPDGEET